MTKKTITQALMLSLGLMALNTHTMNKYTFPLTTSQFRTLKSDMREEISNRRDIRSALFGQKTLPYISDIADLYANYSMCEAWPPLYVSGVVGFKGLLLCSCAYFPVHRYLYGRAYGVYVPYTATLSYMAEEVIKNGCKCIAGILVSKAAMHFENDLQRYIDRQVELELPVKPTITDQLRQKAAFGTLLANENEKSTIIAQRRIAKLKKIFGNEVKVAINNSLELKPQCAVCLEGPKHQEITLLDLPDNQSKSTFVNLAEVSEDSDEKSEAIAQRRITKLREIFGDEFRLSMHNALGLEPQHTIYLKGNDDQKFDDWVDLPCREHIMHRDCQKEYNKNFVHGKSSPMEYACPYKCESRGFF